LVSIIIPVYNRAHLIGETLDSVLAQSYTNWECIIVDDGSTDNSIGVINSYLDLDARFKFYDRPKEKPKGANACRNYGLENANGKYINWFDSDDIMHADFLNLKVETLEQNPELDFCACISSKFKESIKNAEKADRPLIMTSDNYIEDYLINGLYFYTPSPLWKSTFLENKKHFDESLQRSQERDFHFRMLTFQPQFKYLDTVLFYVRVEGESISTKARTSLKAQKSVFKYFDNVFNFLEQTKELKNREKLMAYIFYRQATNYYNINQLCTGFVQRFNILLSHGKSLKNYSKSINALKQHLGKINIGFFVALFAKKGYKYFYFPQYDYAKKE
tara:strand:+ start:16657 stop:17652 length:996 start_codon:yes stop_codon:yes gene_type:complete